MIRRLARLRRSALLAIALALTAGRADGRERIVSVGAAVTEILWDLGAEAEVVGVDSSSRRPSAALASRPDVGYYRRLAPEGLLSLAPTLVVAVDAAGPRETFETLETAGVRVVRLADAWSAAGVRAKIEAIGRLVDDLMPDAQQRWLRWQQAVDGDGGLNQVRVALDDDLDTPSAIAAIDAAVARGEGVSEAALLLGVDLQR